MAVRTPLTTIGAEREQVRWMNVCGDASHTRAYPYVAFSFQPLSPTSPLVA